MNSKEKIGELERRADAQRTEMRQLDERCDRIQLGIDVPKRILALASNYRKRNSTYWEGRGYVPQEQLIDRARWLDELVNAGEVRLVAARKK